MVFPFAAVIGEAISPVTGLIDSLVHSGQEKANEKLTQAEIDSDAQKFKESIDANLKLDQQRNQTIISVAWIIFFAFLAYAFVKWN